METIYDAKCENCGLDNKPKRRYCPKCGNKLHKVTHTIDGFFAGEMEDYHIFVPFKRYDEQ